MPNPRYPKTNPKNIPLERKPDVLYANSDGTVEFDLINNGHGQGQLMIVNFETKEDKNSIWRKYGNEKLKKQYKRIFCMIDHFLFMRAPNFDVVFKWRLLQEQKLKKRSNSNKKIMSYNQIKRFIMFYQRITLQMIKDLSKSASIIIFLNKNHEIKKVLYRKK